MEIKIEVNKKVISARKGESILSALNRNGIKVPTICSMKDFTPTGACRMCVVEVEGKEKLLPACSHPVEEWMKIKTHSSRVIKTRQTIVELLLSNHPDDCLYCERNGNCELQNLAEELHIRERKISGSKSNFKIDKSSPSVIRDPAKCILCGRCVRICEEKQSVATLDFSNRGNRTIIATTLNKPLNFSNCIHCGQCVIGCPTGALIDHVNFSELENAVNDPDKLVVVQYSPAVTVSLGEEFGLKPGKDLSGAMNAAFRKIGFDRVHETAFGADVVFMEYATEILSRTEANENIPVFSSCCPSWVKLVEQSYPELIPHLSASKSPQQSMGTITKNYLSSELNIPAENIYIVSVVPCTSKKFESKRVEHTSEPFTAVDHVITTRELAKLIRINGIDLLNIDAENLNSPFETSSGSSKLMSCSGGSAEAILRNIHFNVNEGKDELGKISVLRSGKEWKEYKLKTGVREFGVVVLNGLRDIKSHLAEIKKRKDIHYVEVMACYGGCIGGGGQPINKIDQALKFRQKTLEDMDEKSFIRTSMRNVAAHKIREDILTGKIPGNREQLYTYYTEREVLQ